MTPQGSFKISDHQRWKCLWTVRTICMRWYVQNFVGRYFYEPTLFEADDQCQKHQLGLNYRSGWKKFWPPQKWHRPKIFRLAWWTIGTMLCGHITSTRVTSERYRRELEVQSRKRSDSHPIRIRFMLHFSTKVCVHTERTDNFVRARSFLSCEKRSFSLLFAIFESLCYQFHFVQ